MQILAELGKIAGVGENYDVVSGKIRNSVMLVPVNAFDVVPGSRLAPQGTLISAPQRLLREDERRSARG